jgi:amidophosphoribosyltransferase
MSQLHEECGVFGVLAKARRDVASTAYYGLFALQHRGQESCGIVVNDDGLFSAHKDTGLVNDVFTPEVMAKLGFGDMAVGHVRYGTTGSNSRANAQPILVNHINGPMALCHNGNLLNSFELRERLELEGSIFHTTSDTEVISYIITKERLTAPSIEDALCRAMRRIQGAYSLVVMSPSKIIAARDPHGFRPLCYGTLLDGGWVVASESCALDAVGASFVRDVEPGEVVVFEPSGVRSIREHCGECKPSLCVFEYIYFARPDSVIDGASVHEARVRAGEFLAIKQPADADIVIGVPDSGLDAAVGYARQSGIPYGIGFIKNRYIGRTFISPGQKSREDKVRIKLNPIASVVRGKRVVLIDDSIVRGTTSKRIVNLLRDGGATEGHFRISSPPFLNPCYYGTDIDSRENLIACRHTIPEIAEIIGVDSLGYLAQEDVHCLADSSACGGYCDACFSGKYPTDVPTKRAKSRFEYKKSERRPEE